MAPEYRHDASAATSIDETDAEHSVGGDYGAELRATRKPLKRRRVRGNATGVPKSKMTDDTMNTDTWRQLSTRARSLFMRLWSFSGGAEYDQDGAVVLHCWASIGKLAELEGCSRRSVERAANELEAAGLIGRQSGKATGQANNWALFPIIDFQPNGGGDDVDDDGRECRTSTPEVPHQSVESVAGVRQNRRTEPLQRTSPNEPRGNEPPAPERRREERGGGGGEIRSSSRGDEGGHSRIVYDMLTACGVWSDTALELARHGGIEADVREAIHDLEQHTLESPAGVVSRLRTVIACRAAEENEGDDGSAMTDEDVRERLTEVYPIFADKSVADLQGQIMRYRGARRWWLTMTPKEQHEALEYLDRVKPCRDASEYHSRYGEPGSRQEATRRAMSAYALICEPAEKAGKSSAAYRKLIRG